MKTKEKIERKRINRKVFLLLLAFGLFLNELNGQTIKDIDPTPKTPQPATFTQPNILKSPTYNNPTPKTPSIYNPNLSIQQRNQLLIQQADRQIGQRQQQRDQLIREAVAEFEPKGIRVDYNLPSFVNIPETKFYKKAFERISKMNENEYSVKEITFLIENAFYEEKENYENFDKIIKQTGKFLLEKMDDFGYDKNSNVQKNYILFQFFADTLQIKEKDLEHLPFTYDFDDFFGKKDWSKMFVTKLLRTGKGQCNSMPQLYLILAEEIGAEAYLSLSPNHSYIRFSDKLKNWYNVELTNGMFSTSSFLTQSGYIKSEALLNKIYMQSLSKKELFSILLFDLASGYTHKFGYDEFSKKIIDQALEIYPNNVNAHMLLADYLTIKTRYVFRQLGVTKENFKTKMQQHPKAFETLKNMKSQYNIIDNLGYTEMPEEAYQDWLHSLRQEKYKRENKEQKERIKKLFKKRIKD
ncbi:MAG TPA: hypothetical protein EYG92_03695 [Lutibacter sp.]|nr:hypothetical protein [Lutibacter sp.]